jgi:hypothetical protein
MVSYVADPKIGRNRTIIRLLCLEGGNYIDLCSAWDVSITNFNKNLVANNSGNDDVFEIELPLDVEIKLHGNFGRIFYLQQWTT